MTKGRFYIVGTAILVVFALGLLAVTWGILFQFRAQGVAKGFEEALVRTYEMGRPIPDGQYVVGAYRVEATHTTGGDKKVRVRVRVMENRTGLSLAESTRSVVPTY
ncbi:MAG: hypothetical protein FJZ01_03880 [Candidatus Sericytochromatia bacterium]|nr:hypothetical protein [Candidatus Tanganyikabacteria bacterium]